MAIPTHMVTKVDLALKGVLPNQAAQATLDTSRLHISAIGNFVLSA